ncbi:MAG: rRNA maturation RNase YbeY [Bacillota bacterium]|nr:rRNA maturation RNase YbeY [Bacillota bacterium]
MTVKVSVYRKKRGVLEDKQSEKTIRACVRETLKSEAFEKNAEVSVSLTDDAGIREINKEHRGIDKATDVLSFPMWEFYNGKAKESLENDGFEDGAVFLGDVVLSVERAVAQALEYGHGVSRELGFLTVHSMLHLLGYDHERGEADAGLMREHEERVLSRLGLSR